MADMRQVAGGGPEAQQGVDDGIRTMRRAQHIRQQMGSGWAGDPGDLHRAAQEEAARQIAAPMNSAAQYQQEQYARIATPRVLNPVGADYDAGTLHAGMGQDGPLSAMLGQAMGQISRGEPSKMFSRETILAILKAQKCLNNTHKVLGMREGGDDVLRSLITIFENLE